MTTIRRPRILSPCCVHGARDLVVIGVLTWLSSGHRSVKLQAAGGQQDTNDLRDAVTQLSAAPSPEVWLRPTATGEQEGCTAPRAAAPASVVGKSLAEVSTESLPTWCSSPPETTEERTQQGDDEGGAHRRPTSAQPRRFMLCSTPDRISSRIGPQMGPSHEVRCEVLALVTRSALKPKFRIEISVLVRHKQNSNVWVRGASEIDKQVPSVAPFRWSRFSPESDAGGPISRSVCWSLFNASIRQKFN